MNFTDSFILQIQKVIDNGVFGVSLFDIAIIFFALIFALLIRGIFAKLIVLKVKKIVRKTSNTLDDKLFDALIPPFKLLPIVLVFLAITLYFDIQSTMGLYLQKISTTLTTIFIFLVSSSNFNSSNKLFS